MNKSELKYKAYLGLLEGKINSKEHKTLIREISFLGKLATGLKSLAKAGGTAFGNFKRMYNDENFKALSAKIGKQIQSSADEIRGLGGKLEIPEEQINFMLTKILTSAAGIKPQTLTQAATNKPPQESTSESGGDEGSIPAEEPKPGTKVDKDNLSTLAQLVADILNTPREKVVAQANQSNVGSSKLTDLIHKSVAKGSGVKQDLVKKVIDSLISTGHLVVEGKKVFAAFNNDEIKLMNESLDGFYRWNKLAGIELLEAKGPDYSLKYVLKRIDSGEIKSVSDVASVLKNKKLAKLTPDQNQSVIDAFEKKKLISPEQEDSAKKELDSALSKVPSSDDSKGEVANVAQALKKFSSAAGAVRQNIKVDEVSDEDLGKILSYLDSVLDDVEIK